MEQAVFLYFYLYIIYIFKATATLNTFKKYDWNSVIYTESTVIINGLMKDAYNSHWKKNITSFALQAKKQLWTPSKSNKSLFMPIESIK